MSKEKYPCTNCEMNEDECDEREIYLKCGAWRRWFREQWEQIRKIFARDVSNRHDEKGDDNE